MKLKYKDHIRIKCWIKCLLICLKNRFITPPRVLSDHGKKVRYSLSRRFHYGAISLYLHLSLLRCKPGEWAPADEGWVDQSDGSGKGLSSWPLAGLGPVFKFILPVCSPAYGPCYLCRCPHLVRICGLSTPWGWPFSLCTTALEKVSSLALICNQVSAILKTTLKSGL